MARRRRFSRRRRVRWDMQTFRLCEDELQLKDGFLATCDAPATDMVMVAGPVAALPAMVQGASRAMMFGGGHLRVRYNMGVVDHSDCPCSHAVHVVTALVKLPLLPNDVTPAYLPNLTGTRTQVATDPALMGDQDEDILWWYDDQLDATNLSCTGGGPVCPIRNSGTDCSTDVDALTGKLGANLEANAGALYGRMTVDQHVRVKRRLKEREALFLVTQWFSNVGTLFGDCPTWPFRRNVYFRYAVRPSR